MLKHLTVFLVLLKGLEGCFQLLLQNDVLTIVCCEGYTFKNNEYCVLNQGTCGNCDNGKCIYSNCVCNAGYQKVNGKCVGLCESLCRNGSCVNNKCICHPGYTSSNKISMNFFRSINYDYDEYTEPQSETINECKPLCNPPCGIEGECVAPHTCKCNEGYENHNETQVCVPSCKNECINGHCVDTDTCVCDTGYAFAENDETKSKCVPVCLHYCGGGKCVAPGKCECNAGFKDNHGLCLPECYSEKCATNEHCSFLTGKCSCSLGYSTNNETSTCEPVCTKPCVNGVCVAPETCRCNDNYNLAEENVCTPACSKECENGYCSDNHVCECNPGFHKEEDGKCLMECNCKNGFCIKPNVCQCFHGYVRNPKNDTECLTKCELKGCENGTCMKYIDECVCNHGFEMNNITQKCEMCKEGTLCNGIVIPYKCDPPCVHGKCILKNVCECHKGYDNLQGSNECKPMCSPDCDNGVCVKPNVCNCTAGYFKGDESNPHVCLPKCDSNCTHGVCSAPNQCTCLRGYEHTNSSKNECHKIKCEHHKHHKDCINEHAGKTPKVDTNKSKLKQDSPMSIWWIVVSVIAGTSLLSAGGYAGYRLWKRKYLYNSSSSPTFENPAYNQING